MTGFFDSLRKRITGQEYDVNSRLFDYPKVRNEALRLLEAHDINEPPVNIVTIIEQHGFEVGFYFFFKENSHVAGYCDISKKKIFVNSNEDIRIQRFAMAHELGHIALHGEEWIGSSEYTMLMKKNISLGASLFRPKEQEANAFAAHLLVPNFMLSKYRKACSIGDLATLFLVPEMAIRYKLRFM